MRLPSAKFNKSLTMLLTDDSAAWKELETDRFGCGNRFVGRSERACLWVYAVDLYDVSVARCQEQEASVGSDGEVTRMWRSGLIACACKKSGFAINLENGQSVRFQAVGSVEMASVGSQVNVAAALGANAVGGDPLHDLRRGALDIYDIDLPVDFVDEIGALERGMKRHVSRTGFRRDCDVGHGSRVDERFAAGYAQSLKSRGLVYAYALAVSEENASGGKIVTAPTCGSCGIVLAVLYHLHTSKGFSEQRILTALATAGLFGNLVKHNASDSGAEVGCQGVVGVACAMAAAAASQLFGGTPAQIEYSAEMGLEHHLGLTCDPVCGLVQIPCIERNAYAAARALDANLYSAFSDGRHSVSFDRIVEVMKQTGHDLPSLYKETSQGALTSVRLKN